MTVVRAPGPEHAAARRRYTGIPSVAVSPKNGRLWIAYYGGITPGEDSNCYVVLTTSADGGRTWKDVLVADPDGQGPERCFDSGLWVAPDGKLRWTFTQRTAKPAPALADYKRAYQGDEGDPRTDLLLSVTLDAENEPTGLCPPVQRIASGVMMCKPTVARDGTWLYPVARWNEAPSACFWASADVWRTYVRSCGAGSSARHNAG